MLREASADDLHGILKLYTFLHDNPLPEETPVLTSLWEKIERDRNHHIVVAEEDGSIVSSCVIVIIPNLTHHQRPYALVENVITHPSYRKRGLASACLDYARQIALKENCYKIMLLTGSKQESTLQFYERCGYNKNDKTAFIQWL